MDTVEIRALTKDATKVIMLVVLIFALWFALVWTNIIPCSFVPGGCDIYWGVLRWDNGMQPKVLIVYNEEDRAGLGSPQILRDVMSDPGILNVRPRLMPLEQVTIGNLRMYDLIIVTQARQISTGKLKVFMEYANTGGRLVWTGDAGTELGEEDEYLYEHERESCETGAAITGDEEGEIISPWARKESGKCINFDQFLGVTYIGKYCEKKGCENNFPETGIFSAPDREQRLVYGITPGLTAYGDFAIVELKSGAVNPTIILNLDYKSNFVSKEGKNYGRYFPIIVQSGFGGKVIYYSIPPEMLASKNMPPAQGTDNWAYTLFVEQMYMGILK